MGEDNVRKRKRKTSTKSGNVGEKNCVPAKKLGRRPVRDENELCHVCGEKARSHNFGGMTCNCCKSFFRHFVLTNVKDNTSIERFKKNCKVKGECEIDQLTRKKCKTCRFFKCVKIGMDPKWVLSDFKKMQKNKAASTNKKPNYTQRDAICPTIDQKISDEDAIKIASISEFYNTACELIPYNFPSRDDSSTVLTTNKITILLIGVISTAMRRFVYFARMLPEFEKLSLHDQTSLLRGSAIQLFILRSAVTYDLENNIVNSKAGNFPEKYPEITLEECAAICSDEVADMHLNVYKRIRSLAPDEASIMLMLPLVLFSDSGGSGEVCTQFEDRPIINAAQELYASLLEKYLRSVYGVEKGRVVYPRLLCQLMELTQISQLHQGVPLNMTEDQVDKMHKHLLALQRKASFPVLQETERCTRSKEQKECCLKQAKSVTSRKVSKLELANQSQPQGISADAFQIIIHSFASLTSNWGIKPDYFAKGAHLGIQNAFMRRIPELLNNPWDCLVDEVEEDKVAS